MFFTIRASVWILWGGQVSWYLPSHEWLELYCHKICFLFIDPSSITNNNKVIVIITLLLLMIIITTTTTMYFPSPPAGGGVWRRCGPWGPPEGPSEGVWSRKACCDAASRAQCSMMRCRWDRSWWPAVWHLYTHHTTPPPHLTLSPSWTGWCWLRRWPSPWRPLGYRSRPAPVTRQRHNGPVCICLRWGKILCWRWAEVAHQTDAYTEDRCTPGWTPNNLQYRPGTNQRRRKFTQWCQLIYPLKINMF